MKNLTQGVCLLAGSNREPDAAEQVIAKYEDNQVTLDYQPFETKEG